MPTVLITGANKGLGFELLNIFLEKKWNVFPLIRNQKFAEEINNKYSSNCFPIVGDVGFNSVENKIIEILTQHTDSLDVLINNAGFVNIKRGFKKATTSDISEHFNVHCLGVFRCVKATLPFLEKAKYPKVINISSRWSSIKRTYNRQGDSIYAYNIAKASQNMLTATFQNEFKENNIQFYAVHPGKLLTKIAARDADTPPRKAAEKMFEWITQQKQDPTGLYDLMEDKILDW